MRVAVRRRKKEPMGLRESPQIRCPGHLAWVRGHECVVLAANRYDKSCEGRVEAAHVRSGTDGGLGKKPGDNFTFPACAGHHAEQHRIGEQQFARKYRLNLREIADALWARSPHGKKWRMER